MSLQKLTLELDVPEGVDLVQLQDYFRAIADQVERLQPGCAMSAMFDAGDGWTTVPKAKLRRVMSTDVTQEVGRD